MDQVLKDAIRLGAQKAGLTALTDPSGVNAREIGEVIKVTKGSQGRSWVKFASDGGLDFRPSFSPDLQEHVGDLKALLGTPVAERRPNRPIVQNTFAASASGGRLSEKFWNSLAQWMK